MMDVIGADETTHFACHLNRAVADCKRTLAALCAIEMEVSPHIMIGLHYGRLLGDANALDMIAPRPANALVLVVVTPFYAGPETFVIPASGDVGEIFLQARLRLPDRHMMRVI